MNRSQNTADAARRLDELCGLVRAAGGMVSRIEDLRLRQVVSATFLGKGQLERLAETVKATDAQLVAIDAELTGTQMRNIEETVGVRVIDRTGLILDIFALRARTLEGKLQVELAQHAYMLPRLVGKRLELSRLGGGIGTRGPGETALETDRRVIRKRMGVLRRRLDQVRQTRATQREGRSRRETPVVAVVGYTNAGKTTLINKITGAELYAADMLFATLDPTLRQAALPGKIAVLFSDTVGFIRDLPHQLVEAFQATLEEVRQADLLLHVVDAADPALSDNVAAVNQVLEQIDAADKPLLTVLNKVDRLDPEARGELRGSTSNLQNALMISASSGEGLDQLALALARGLGNPAYRVELEIEHRAGWMLAELQRDAEVIELREAENGLSISARMGYTLLTKLKQAASKGICVKLAEPL